MHTDEEKTSRSLNLDSINRFTEAMSQPTLAFIAVEHKTVNNPAHRSI